MRKAYHPVHDDTRITVPEHVAEFGNDPVNSWERARCPVCKQRLNNVASSSPNSIGHFSHQRNSGYCPTKSTAAAPYAGLPPRNPDPEAARRIKQVFLNNWEKHYSMLNWIVKGLSIDEFKKIIQLANRERIWEYSDLVEFQLPYIFATLTDFPPHRSYKDKKGEYVRKKWFRNWFDPTVQRYDDLWIHRETPLLFWRAWYEIPSTRKKPKIEDLIDSYPLPLTNTFLTYEPSIAESVRRAIQTWLDQHFIV